MNGHYSLWLGRNGVVGSELAKPISSLSIESTNGRLVYVTLWRPDGTGLLVHSEMHDVAERREVGILQFGRVHQIKPQESVLEAPAAFRQHLSVKKLVIRESEVDCESGVVFQAHSGEEMIILAGVAIHSLAVHGVTYSGYTFQPEYSLEQYSRIELG
jgi:hypothetical protein